MSIAPNASIKTSIKIGLGSNSKNGTWQTFTRDLEADLKAYEPDNELLTVNGFLVRGSGRVDDIAMMEYGNETVKANAEDTTITQHITYQHNALNQRVAKLVDGEVVEKYLWTDLTTLLATYDANDNLVQRFEYANGRMPVAMTSNGEKYYLHYDQVGSLRAISRVLSPDNTTELVKEITYDTYGNIINDTNPTLSVPFGFAGGLYDHDTKLTRFGYRDYDAYTGKWTAKDSIGFDGGDSNLYGYVLGNPVSGFDASGLYYPPAVGAVAGGFIGGFGSLWNGGKWDGDFWNGAAVGAVGGAAAGFCAGMGNLPGASAAWDGVSIGADIVINASNGAMGASSGGK